MSDHITITAAHIHELHDAEFGANRNIYAVLAVTSNGLEVIPNATAEDLDDCEIITDAVTLWEHCDGELSDSIAEQLAQDLTESRAMMPDRSGPADV